MARNSRIFSELHLLGSTFCWKLLWRYSSIIYCQILHWIWRQIESFMVEQTKQTFWKSSSTSSWKRRGWGREVRIKGSKGKWYWGGISVGNKVEVLAKIIVEIGPSNSRRRRAGQLRQWARKFVKYLDCLIAIIRKFPYQSKLIFQY